MTARLQWRALRVASISPARRPGTTTDYWQKCSRCKQAFNCNHTCQREHGKRGADNKLSTPSVQLSTKVSLLRSLIPYVDCGCPPITRRAPLKCAPMHCPAQHSRAIKLRAFMIPLVWPTIHTIQLLRAVVSHVLDRVGLKLKAFE